MASRKEQKEAARQRRLAEEQAAQAKTQRTRRLQALGGVIVAAIVVVVVLVVVSSSGGSKHVDATKPTSAAAKSTAAKVNAALAGIPQSAGMTLGNPKAPVTMTEYGDLECSICRDFALSSEAQLIANEVKQGKVKLVYKSYETATSGAADGATIFPIQQSAAYAAGAQDKGWNYVELFYHEQGQEDTEYVDAAYLDGIAKQVPGLDYTTWSNQRFNPKYSSQVIADHNEATKLGITGTPGIIFSGPKAQTRLYSGLLSYAQLQQLVKQVS